MAYKSIWTNQEEIACLEKNKNEKIKISRCHGEEEQYIDIRILKKPFGSDDYIHTDKGICAPLSLWEEIISVIKSTEDNV